MDLNYTNEELAFQQEVRTFMETKLPKRTSEKVRYHNRLTKDELTEWHALLNEAGYLTAHWPKEFGGKSWNAIERSIFDEEMSMAHGPRIVPAADRGCGWREWRGPTPGPWPGQTHAARRPR